MVPPVIEVLRRFLPEYQRSQPALDSARRRAIWAITHCRTPAMGGHLHACEDCNTKEFVCHSCNHRSCPQCGRNATAQWVDRELCKRVGAPYFMVTFTLPSGLREYFFGAHAKRVYDLFFEAAAEALSDMLAIPRFLGAEVCGFTAVLHTWNQRLGFHPHIHCMVPGAGINSAGKVVTVNYPKFLVDSKVLSKAFRTRFLRKFSWLARELGLDPIASVVRHQKWGVDLQACGDGGSAVRYLGTYICRTAISDSRMVASDADTVTYKWKDRKHGNVIREETIPGEEFITRYLRHVLPPGMRAARRYGFCHPAAKRARERIALHTGRPIFIGGFAPLPTKPATPPRKCPCCDQPMQVTIRILPAWRRSRGPPLS